MPTSAISPKSCLSLPLPPAPINTNTKFSPDLSFHQPQPICGTWLGDSQLYSFLSWETNLLCNSFFNDRPNFTSKSQRPIDLNSGPVTNKPHHNHHKSQMSVLPLLLVVEVLGFEIVDIDCASVNMTKPRPCTSEPMMWQAGLSFITLTSR